MREILFRGKRTDNRQWVYGYLANGDTIANCYDGFHSNTYKIDPATVGQYTGTIDPNGRQVYEGDIIGYTNFETDKTNIFGVARWSKVGCFYINCHSLYNYNIDDPGNAIGNMMPSHKSLTVIGNIHDNPDLIKQG